MTKRKQPVQPTPEQVAAEIAALRDMMPRIRRMTGFGEDNHEAIEAQINVLEKRLDENDIYDRYQATNDDGEPDEEGNRHSLDNALDARRWLDGEKDEAPSIDWMPLKKL